MRIYLIQLPNGCKIPMVAIAYIIYTTRSPTLQVYFVRNAGFASVEVIFVFSSNTQNTRALTVIASNSNSAGSAR